MRLLFVKHSLEWPRVSGHDVYTFEMMRALAQLGHEVALVTAGPPDAAAIEGLTLAHVSSLQQVPDGRADVPKLSWVQERFRSYWGIDAAHICRVGETAAEWRADAAVVVGLEALPYFGALKGATRIWYPADEWVWHHLSLVKWSQAGSWHHFRPAVVKGAYERAYRQLIDRVWVVTQTERRAMRWFGGMRTVDVVPLGIDGERFQPLLGPERPFSAVFWGRLDFEPNIQGLEWFCRCVWPLVRREAPSARFTIVGFHPGPAVQRLAETEGVSLAANLDDLRDEVSRHQVVVLPFVSGGGIKNKLLEAAALGRPIVCTPRACNGLIGLTGRELVSVQQPVDWCRAMLELWNDGSRRSELGVSARNWVLANHDWRAIARRAVETLERRPEVREREHAGGQYAA